MTLPRGAQQLIDLRRSRMRPADPVLVSFVGALPEYDAAQVFPVPGVRYDWGFMEDLHAHVVVEPGIDAEETIDALAEVCRPYVGVIDIQRKQVAFVLAFPGRIWQAERGSMWWREWFSEE